MGSAAKHVAHAMHDLIVMATQTFDFQTHDHAGARWLASLGPAVLFAILTGFIMLVYPHL